MGGGSALMFLESLLSDGLPSGQAWSQLNISGLIASLLFCRFQHTWDAFCYNLFFLNNRIAEQRLKISRTIHQPPPTTPLMSDDVSLIRWPGPVNGSRVATSLFLFPSRIRCPSHQQDFPWDLLPAQGSWCAWGQSSCPPPRG